MYFLDSSLEAGTIAIVIIVFLTGLFILFLIIRSAVSSAIEREFKKLLAIKMAEAKKNGITLQEIKKAEKYFELINKTPTDLSNEEKEKRAANIEVWWSREELR